jgi:hypothetical protein
MTDIADRWLRLRPLLDRAIDLENDARCAYLDALRGESDELCDDLRSLLAARERSCRRPLPSALALVASALAGEGRDACVRESDSVECRRARATN